MWVKLCQNTTFYLTNTISLRDRLIYFVKISHESIIITISNWKLIITMPLYVESDFRWDFMCKFKESVKWKRNKFYCRKKFEWNLIAFLLSVFFVDNNILFCISVKMSVNADSPANRLKSYKNKALDSQELRRRREEEGIQLRKQKRDEQVNTIFQVMAFALGC